MCVALLYGKLSHVELKLFMNCYEIVTGRTTNYCYIYKSITACTFVAAIQYIVLYCILVDCFMLGVAVSFCAYTVHTHLLSNQRQSIKHTRVCVGVV